MRTLARSLFTDWRRLLAALLRLAGRTASGIAKAPGDALRDVTSSVRGPATTEVRQARLLAFGLLATATGALGTVLLSREARSGLVAAGLWTLWSIARLPLMRLAAQPSDDTENAALLRAWTVGLLPLGAAVVPVLRPAAWALSAGLTYRVLRLADFQPRRCAWVLAWGYGSQAVAGVIAWLARNLVAARLVLGLPRP